MYVVLGALVVLLLMQLTGDLRLARSEARGTPLWRMPLGRAGLFFAFLLVGPWLFVHVSGMEGILAGNGGWLFVASVGLSAMISYTWYRYLTWLDVFERERIWAELLTFVMACGSTLLVFPITAWLRGATGMALTGDLWDDLVYSVVAIGLVEEVVKLLPYLLVWRLTRQVDEPFDHLLYGSIAALGFAFMENTLYLESTRLTAVTGRALLASVAHMFDTSIVCYSVALALHRKRPWVPALLLGLVLASLAHGFYDLWLLAPGRPVVLTIVFFLGSIQLWVIMKNNLLNLSPRFHPGIKLASAMFRYRIINGMLAIFLLAWVLVFLLDGRERAMGMLLGGWQLMAAMLVFLALSFSNFVLVRGYLAPVRPASNLFRLFLPIAKHGDDLSGRRVTLLKGLRGNSGGAGAIHADLPVTGELIGRMVVKGDADWYLFRPQGPSFAGSPRGGAYLLKPAVDLDLAGTGQRAVFLLLGLREGWKEGPGGVPAQDLFRVGRFLGSLV